ncbi:vitamin B6 photo-protection and homoeostasis-domain-containing protein [Phycomyces blakesleeanus]|uniref:Vitamin B6 photo-protection and homoeostasis-domain-containing protein n=1 Tax=Phycomyces blakesleeanus TaxID=4837 RepID=A0ABR3B5R2_PHYBL
MLASLGLGAMEATGGAVAIQWVLKDGIGEIGKLFFIKRYASSFDSHPKTWKFVCELLSSVGSFLQLCTSIASPKLFLPLAALGNTFELIHESIWMASHMTFTKHFAPSGNVGDIVAKDDAQMSSAHLLGMLSGVGLISVSHSPLFLFGAFAVLSPINIWATYKMLNSAEFEILNQAKLMLLSKIFIDTGKVVGYEALRNREIGFGEWIKPSGTPGGVSARIKLGASASSAYSNTNEVEDVIDIMQHENYLINYHKGTMWVMFHEDSRSNDVIKAVLHANKFHDMLAEQNIHRDTAWDKYNEILKESLEWSKEHYPTFVAELDSKEWQSNAVYWNDRQVFCAPAFSFEGLVRY